MSITVFLLFKKSVKQYYQVTRSSSLMSMRKDEISFDKIASIFSGLSTKEYFMAITTVARVKAAGLVVLSYTKSISDVKTSLPEEL